jgi:flagellar biosynthesis GTPase FlhF
MPKAFELVPVGYEKTSGRVVEVPRFSMLIVGGSGSGKTTTVKRLVEELRKAVPDLKVLSFDVKETGRDFEGFGRDLVPYINQTIDTRFLRDLIEGSEHRRIDWLIPQLGKACERANTIKEVLNNIDRLMKTKLHPVVLSNFDILRFYLQPIARNLEEFETSTKFELPHDINVVPINYAESSFKEHVVYSYIKALFDHRCQRVLIVLDEASLLAGERGAVCKFMVKRLLKAGRQAELFTILSDQDVKGIDISIRSQAWTQFFGMQTDERQALNTANQIPFSGSKKRALIDEIFTLGVGFFIAVIRYPSRTEVKRVFIRAPSVSEQDAIQVAKGVKKVEEVMDKMVEQEEDETVLRESYDTLKQEHERLTKKHEQTLAELERIRKHEQELTEKMKSFVERKPGDTSATLKPVVQKKPLEPTPTNSAPVPAWDQIVLLVDERLRELSAKGELQIVTVNVNERLRELVKEDMVQGFTSVIRDLKEPEKRILRFLALKGSSSLGDAWAAFSKKAYVGKAASMLHARLTPMEHAGLISVTENQVTWNVPTILAQTLPEEDVKQVNEYLKSLLL